MRFQNGADLLAVVAADTPRKTCKHRDLMHGNAVADAVDPTVQHLARGLHANVGGIAAAEDHLLQDPAVAIAQHKLGLRSATVNAKVILNGRGCRHQLVYADVQTARQMRQDRRGRQCLPHLPLAHRLFGIIQPLPQRALGQAKRQAMLADVFCNRIQKMFHFSLRVAFFLIIPQFRESYNLFFGEQKKKLYR